MTKYPDVNFKQVEYERYKIATAVICNPKLSCSEDLIIGDLQYKLTASIYQRMLEKQTKTIELERPTFMEWLFRKKRTVVQEVSAYEVLKKPYPVETDRSVIMYEMDLLKGDRT